MPIISLDNRAYQLVLEIDFNTRSFSTYTRISNYELFRYDSLLRHATYSQYIHPLQLYVIWKWAEMPCRVVPSHLHVLYCRSDASSLRARCLSYRALRQHRVVGGSERLHVYACVWSRRRLARFVLEEYAGDRSIGVLVSPIDFRFFHPLGSRDC